MPRTLSSWSCDVLWYALNFATSSVASCSNMKKARVQHPDEVQTLRRPHVLKDNYNTTKYQHALVRRFLPGRFSGPDAHDSQRRQRWSYGGST